MDFQRFQPGPVSVPASPHKSELLGFGSYDSVGLDFYFHETEQRHAVGWRCIPMPKEPDDLLFLSDFGKNRVFHQTTVERMEDKEYRKRYEEYYLRLRIVL